MTAVNFKADNVQKHKNLSNQIKETLAVAGRTINEPEKHKAYYANLPEGQTQKSVEELSKYNSAFVTASHVAVGELATEIFMKDPDAQQVEASIGFFGKGDSIDMTVNRQKIYQNHLADNEADKEITKHLVIKATVTTQSAKGYGVKAVKESMSEEFVGMTKK
jgi:hypothetical protein